MSKKDILIPASMARKIYKENQNKLIDFNGIIKSISDIIQSKAEIQNYCDIYITNFVVDYDSILVDNMNACNLEDITNFIVDNLMEAGYKGEYTYESYGNDIKLKLHIAW